MFKIILAILAFTLAACSVSTEPECVDSTQPFAAPDFCYTHTAADFHRGVIECTQSSPVCAFDRANEPTPLRSQLAEVSYYCDCADNGRYYCWGSPGLPAAEPLN